MSLNTPVLKAGPTDTGAPSGQPTVTSPSFTPSANSLLLAFIELNNDVSGSVPSVVSVTTSGLTWTRQVWKNGDAGSTGGAGTDSGSEIWTAPVGASPVAMTVAAVTQRSGATGNVEAILTIVEITDTSGSVPTVGNIGATSSTSGLPSVTITTSAGSYLFAGASDWSAGGAGSYATGTTSIADGTRATQVSWRIMRSTSTTSAGSTTLAMTAPSGQTFDMAALEVLGTGGGGGSTIVSPVQLLGPNIAATRAATI